MQGWSFLWQCGWNITHCVNRASTSSVGSGSQFTRRASKLVVVCDMVVHLPGRHAVTARRVDAFISRLRGRPSAPSADWPETPNDTKDAWHDDVAGRRRISVLLTIDDDRTPPPPSRCYRPCSDENWLIMYQYTLWAASQLVLQPHPWCVCSIRKSVLILLHVLSRYDTILVFQVR